jgi:CDP-diacylglycerol--serine O-phosphatidyltransferase
VKRDRQKSSRNLRRGAYLLPSLFTVGTIVLGFYAVIRGLREDFASAALMIILAGVLDNLDGRIARLTHTESDFGREFDSLADVLTFGAAPAFLAHLWGFRELGRVGWLLPLFFLVCATTRLARFNVQTKIMDRRFFVGLPVPAAAGSVAAVVFFAPDAQWHPWLPAVLLAALAWLGLLMVSTFRYRSFKEVDLKKRWSYRVAPPLAAFVLLMIYQPSAFFLSVAILYTSSGPVGWLVNRLRSGSQPREESPPEQIEP